MARQIDSIDGVKVITQQRAFGPHPHPQYNGVMVPFNNVLHIILENEKELFACEVCGEPFDRITQAVAHLSKHSTKNGQPDTPIKLIQTMLGAVQAAKDSNSTSPFADAADSLNDRKIRTVRGRRWTEQNVRQMYSTYNGQYTARLPRQHRRTIAVPLQSSALETPQPILDAGGPDIPVLRNNRLLEVLDDLEASVTSVDSNWAKIEQGIVKIASLMGQVQQIVKAIHSEGHTNATLQQKADAYDRIIQKLDQSGIKIEH